ncbi:Uncharacterised protein [Vibrio cholerae]|nr:Uncharacterised protein [Vibrio cholerae]
MDGIKLSAAHLRIWLPISVEPVNASLSIRWLVANALPASEPKPLTTLITPAGIKSPIISIKNKIETGVCSAGLRTTVQPAARAGANFQAAMSNGKFHGIIWPTTPIGSGK